jgi:hypothetical protein
MSDEPINDRRYDYGPFERFRRHVRAHYYRAFLGGVSFSAIVAGFMDATGVSWSLIVYVVLAAIMMMILLGGRALANPRYRYLLLVPGRLKAPPRAGQPARLAMVAAGSTAPVRQIEAARCPDPVYGGGFRAICGPSDPLVIVASNRRDVSKPHELLFPMFADGHRRSRIKIDALTAGIPIEAYKFEREWSEGVQDSEHTLAIKDLAYLAELGDALRSVGAGSQVPLIWPEHCVDPRLLSRRDVIVVGGADTNFWHAGLFEPVVREFEQPASSVPLALDLRDTSGAFPVYGSRLLTARLARLDSVFQHTRGDEVELDERVFPTYGMLLACRNPYASAVGESRWCVFIAGTRSLGTSGGVLALVMMLKAMASDPARNFYSQVPTAAPDVQACVSAVLYRTSEVEQSMLRRGNQTVPRERRWLRPDVLDPDYSDTYIPTGVEYLSYAAGQPAWELLGRIEGSLPAHAGESEP